MLGFFAEHSEDAEANAAAFDHEVAADHPLLGQALEIGQRGVVLCEVGVRGEHRRNVAGFGGHADGLAQAVRPEVEFMVAEGGGVVAHPGHELQFATGLSGGGGERGPHAVVARVKHQHRPLTLARFLPLGDQRGQTRVPAPGRVIVERERGVVRGRTHADEGRVHVVGVQDGEGLLPVGAADSAPGRQIVAPTAAEPARNSRRESGSHDMRGLFAVWFSLWRPFVGPLGRTRLATDAARWVESAVPSIRRYLLPAAPSFSFSITSSRLKLAAFCRCG